MPNGTPRVDLAKLSLLQKQWQMTRMTARLLDKAHELGFEATLGDAMRDARVFGAQGVRMGYGQAASAHKNRLALDLNLFKDGAYCSTTEAHRELGEWWESQGGVWGGRFDDGNHYSLEHGGVK
jgi:hypothetical protein